MMGWTPPADGIEVPAWKWCATTTKAGDVRMQITTVGLDIAKNLFQVHGADAQGHVLLKRKLARGKVLEFFATLPACLVGLEACGAAHYWARELTRLGHEVRLMPPQYVRPYVRTNKHDAADAEACCEAVQRPRSIEGFGLIGRSFSERLPRAARANIADGMNGRTGVGRARTFPRATSP